MATACSSFWRRAAVAVTFVATACTVVPAVTGSTAEAATPKPSLKDLQNQLHTMEVKLDGLTSAYDASVENLQKAQKQLTVYNQWVKTDQAAYDQLRTAVAQLAATAYKNSGGMSTGPLGPVLAAKDPGEVLSDMSVVTALTKDRSSILAQFISQAAKVKAAQGAQQTTINQIKATQASITTQKNTLTQQARKMTALVTAAGGPAPHQGTCHVTAATIQAQKAIDFACSKLGTPYLWGGTGPEYDCSGLTQAAWAAAGISLPRTSQEQFTVYQRVSYNQLQPGDLLFFESSIGHVGMYLGGGMMIHSPHTGDVVRISDVSSGFYRDEFQGGVHIA